MNDLQRTVTVIPAKPQMNQLSVKRQLRVAAYCRVSTEEEEQQSSYEAQCTYYTDKIMTNPEWTMAGIFADEGITGTSTKKRDDFNRMIRKCRQKKIDLILTKSISRFARNTLDSLKYIRALKELGIGIIFEKENINTLEMDTELIITFMSDFAQSESESISANVRWGKRQAMKEGKTSVNFRKLYSDIQRGRSDVLVRPRFMVWENVPGAFSSGEPKGEDFRIALEEIIRIVFDSVSVPGPDTGRWESAGCILLGDSFSLAWRVLDAQYWGVPQRRRRIYLVADFGGQTAPKILFNQESLPRDFTSILRTGQTPADGITERP